MLKAIKYKITEVPQDYWDFVNNCGTIYQSKPYLDCLAVSGKKQLVIAVFEDDKLIGGAGVTVGHKVFNFPANMNTYFGPVVNNAQKAAGVLKCIAGAIKTMCLRFSVIALPEHADILTESSELSDWHKREIEFIHWDISGPLESIWGKTKKKNRQNVRRAERDGVVIKDIETAEDIEQFFMLYSMSMSKGGLESEESVDFFKNLISTLKPSGTAAGFLALHPVSRQPIAGSFLLLGMHGTGIHLAKGHNYEFRKFHGPDLLIWHCVEFLKSKGFTIFDLVGLPKEDSEHARSICKYKTDWVGTNGRHYPSYILTHGNFGLNPQFMKKVSVIFKRLIAFISKGGRK